MRESVQTFWCVANDIFTDGTARTQMFGRKLVKKPEDTLLSKPEKDSSRKWFDDKEEAEAYFNKINQPKITVRHEPVYGLLTPGEAAMRLGVKEKYLYKLAQNGKIPCNRICGLVRFDPVDIENYKFFSKYNGFNIHFEKYDKEKLLELLEEWHAHLKKNIENLSTPRPKKVPSGKLPGNTKEARMG